MNRKKQLNTGSEDKRQAKIVWYVLGLVAVVALLYVLLSNSFTSSYLKTGVHNIVTRDEDNDSSTTTQKLLTTATSTYFSMVYYIPAENEAATNMFTESAANWLLENNIKDVTSPKQAEELGLTEDGCREYEYSGDYTKHKGGPYVSYVGEVYSFTCGAHGSTYHIIYNENTQTGKQITKLTDIFIDSVYAHLSEKAKSSLPNQLKQDKGVEVSELGEMFTDGISPSPENYKAFYFDGGDLVIIFGQYAIGPYVIGITEFRVPLSSLIAYKK
jgi:hypothetical protein